jgi:hypothetical protein
VRLELTDQVALVCMSARNLAALQHKLTLPAGASYRMLPSGDVYRDGLPVEKPLLIVRAEPDAEHYGDPRRLEPPGPMHPATEQFIAETAAVGIGVEAVAEPGQPWLRFDEHGELSGLLAENIGRVQLVRWHDRKVWLRLDDLYLELTTIPAHGPFVIRSAAWSEAIDHPPYRNTLLQDAQATRLIHGDTNATAETGTGS